MKLKYYFTLFGLALLSSCTIHYNNQINSSVGGIVQRDSDVTYIDKVYGYSSVNYIFRIGGFNRITTAESFRVLQNAANLKDGQFLDNITLDQRRFFFLPFFVRQELILSADILELADKNKLKYDSLYLAQRESFHSISKKGFRLNDDVCFTMNNPPLRMIRYAKVIELGKYKAKLIAPNNNGRLETFDIRYSNLFIEKSNPLSPLYFGLDIGDTLNYYRSISTGFPRLKKERLVAYSYSDLIIEDSLSSITSIPIQSIIINDFKASSKYKLGYSTFLSDNLNLRVVVYLDGKLSEGILKEVNENTAIIKLTPSQELLSTDVTNVFTKEKAVDIQGIRSYYKSYIRAGNNVLYVMPDNPTIKKSVKVIGFQNFRVIIEFPSGEIEVVSIGELNDI